MFQVGQKVVCVDDQGQAINEGDTAARKGRVYTIREYYSLFGEPGVRLEEIMNPKDRGYFAWRFRPVVERKTDISIFTAMLNPKHQPVNVE